MTSSPDGRLARWPSRATPRGRRVSVLAARPPPGARAWLSPCRPPSSGRPNLGSTLTAREEHCFSLPTERPVAPPSESLTGVHSPAAEAAVRTSAARRPHRVPSSWFDSHLDGLLHRPAVRSVASGADHEVHRVSAPRTASLPAVLRPILSDAMPSRAFPLHQASCDHTKVGRGLASSPLRNGSALRRPRGLEPGGDPVCPRRCPGRFDPWLSWASLSWRRFRDPHTRGCAGRVSTDASGLGTSHPARRRGALPAVLVGRGTRTMAEATIHQFTSSSRNPDRGSPCGSHEKPSTRPRHSPPTRREGSTGCDPPGWSAPTDLCRDKALQACLNSVPEPLPRFCSPPPWPCPKAGPGDRRSRSESSSSRPRGAPREHGRRSRATPCVW